jgi:hypothetical protein
MEKVGSGKEKSAFRLGQGFCGFDPACAKAATC